MKVELYTFIFKIKDSVFGFDSRESRMVLFCNFGSIAMMDRPMEISPVIPRLSPGTMEL